MDDHPTDLEQPWHAPPDQAALRARAYNLRWAETDDDVIPLTAADPDLPTAEVLLDLAHQLDRLIANFISDIQGVVDVREAVFGELGVEGRADHL